MLSIELVQSVVTMNSQLCLSGSRVILDIIASHDWKEQMCSIKPEVSLNTNESDGLRKPLQIENNLYCFILVRYSDVFVTFLVEEVLEEIFQEILLSYFNDKSVTDYQK